MIKNFIKIRSNKLSDGFNREHKEISFYKTICHCLVHQIQINDI